MAESGPLVRVNTERDTVIKMTQKQAKEFIASHPGARVVPGRTNTEIPTPDLHAEGEKTEAKAGEPASKAAAKPKA